MVRRGEADRHQLLDQAKDAAGAVAGGFDERQRAEEPDGGSLVFPKRVKLSAHNDLIHSDAEQIDNAFAKLTKGRTEMLQRFCRQGIGLLRDAEQKVLRAGVPMVHRASFLDRVLNELLRLVAQRQFFARDVRPG